MNQVSETLERQIGGRWPLARFTALALTCVLIGYMLATHGFSQSLFFSLALSVSMAFIAARFPWLAVVSPMVIFIVMGIGLSSGLSAAGASINLADLLLLPALAPTVVKVLAGRRDLDYPSIPAIMLGAWIMIAACAGIFYGNPYSLVRNELHVLLFVPLAYYWALIELRSPRDIKLAVTALISATAIAGLKSGFISFFVGHTQEGYSDIWQASTAVSEQLGGQRTILNGADTFFVLIMPIIASLALFYRDRRTMLLLAGAFVLSLYGLLISLTRTNWATVIVALLLLLVFGARSVGGRAVRVAATVGLLSILALFLSSYMTFGTSTYDLGELLQRRLEPNPYTGTGNLNYRIRESQALMEQAERHIVLGNGLGSRFAFIEFRGATSVNWAHNGHLWMLLKSGLAGLVLFYAAIIWVITQLIIISNQSILRLFRAVALGFAVALFSLMLMSFLVNRISNMEGAYFIGLAVALPQIMKRIEANTRNETAAGVITYG